MPPRPSGYDRRAFLASLAAAACLLDGPGAVGACDRRLTRQVLDRSLALGTRFLLHNQKKAGHFRYELDWKTLAYTDGDSPVRQAGAAWGLALIHQAQPAKAVERALVRALAFFDKCSKLTVDGRRYIVYPSADFGALGTVALTALALIDYLRVKPSTALRDKLDGYLAFIVAARLEGGRFHQSFEHEGGRPVGKPSPYFDGEALLALTKAARYLGRNDLREVVLAEAEAGYQANVVAALKADPDSDVTKGYYQWSSMAYYELATWSAIKSDVHAKRLLALADWMVDVHRTLSRSRNTGYAYEGIIPAYAIALRDGDQERAKRLRRVIDCGMTRLCSWQLGNPLANAYIRSQPEHDARAVGGVQNHRAEPKLRIDVTQHQMHAVILARRHVFTS